jgi:uncharacterized membrane protein
MSTQQAGRNTVYNIVLFSFQGQKTAAGIVETIKARQQLAGYKLIAEAVVERDASGKLHIHEPGKEGLGGGVGAVAGGLVGLFFGPAAVLFLAVTGGAIGGVAGHFAGRAIPADDLKQLGDALPLNSSAFVVLIEDTEAERLVGTMQGYTTNVVTVTVGDELSGEIDMILLADVEQTGADTARDAAATPASESAPAVAATSQAPAKEEAEQQQQQPA